MKKVNIYKKQDIYRMLRESNNIEGVYNDDALELALIAWDFIKIQPLLDIYALNKTHKILMEGRLNNNYLGQFRRTGVTIGGYSVTPWTLLFDAMKDWCTKANLDETDPIEHHIAFEKIHPYIDGNGRMGRILMNWMNVRQGRELVIYTAADRSTYYKLFKTTMKNTHELDEKIEGKIYNLLHSFQYDCSQTNGHEEFIRVKEEYTEKIKSLIEEEVRKELENFKNTNWKLEIDNSTKPNKLGSPNAEVDYCVHCNGTGYSDIDLGAWGKCAACKGTGNPL